MHFQWLLSREGQTEGYPLDLQPFLTCVAVFTQCLGCALKHNAAVPHDETTVGNRHGDGELLLDQQH